MLILNLNWIRSVPQMESECRSNAFKWISWILEVSFVGSKCIWGGLAHCDLYIFFFHFKHQPELAFICKAVQEQILNVCSTAATWKNHFFQSVNFFFRISVKKKKSFMVFKLQMQMEFDLLWSYCGACSHTQIFFELGQQINIKINLEFCIFSLCFGKPQMSVGAATRL